jgi:hypothetical protein
MQPKHQRTMQANKHNQEEINKSITKNESSKEVEEKSNHQNRNEEHTQQQQVTNSRRPQPKHPFCTKRGNQQLKKMSKNHTTTQSRIGTLKVTPSSKAQSSRITDWFQATPPGNKQPIQHTQQYSSPRNTYFWTRSSQ